MASGDSLYAWTAHANEPPLADFAPYNTRNAHFVLEFDDTTNQAAVFRGVMARNYGNSGVTVRVAWMGAAATTGNVKWNAQFERHAVGDDLDADSFATAQTVTEACAAASGRPVYTSIPFTDGAQIDSLAVGEGFRLKVTRDAADALDTMTGKAQLLSVELSET